MPLTARSQHWALLTQCDPWAMADSVAFRSALLALSLVRQLGGDDGQTGQRFKGVMSMSSMAGYRWSCESRPRRGTASHSVQESRRRRENGGRHPYSAGGLPPKYTKPDGEGVEAHPSP